ncbi:MAG: DNA polymerase III subunit gamma/tau, partial [Limisphaerales bacterium]
VSQFTRGYLLEAHPVSFNGKLFTIGFDPEFADHMALVDNAKNHTVLQTKLGELGHHGCQLKFIKAEAPTRPASAAQPAAPAPTKTETPTAALKPIPGAAKSDKPQPFVFDKESFKNDPLIQKALEVFKGTIVEVRA